MTENDAELLVFAERLVRLVRDRAIEECDGLARGEFRGPLGKRWRELATDGLARDALGELVPDVVDQVLFQLLDAVDNDLIPPGWQRDDGAFVRLGEIGRGEMAGCLMMGEGGWLDRFSLQRFFDPLADFHPGDTGDSGGA